MFSGLWQQFFSHFGADDFPSNFLLKMLQNRRFSPLGRRPILELQFVYLFCLILLGFATSCLQIAVEWLRQGSSLLQLRLSFAAEIRKSYCSGRIKVANGALAVAAEFFHFGADDFPFISFYKIPFKKCFKIVILLLGLRSVFGAAICVAIVRARCQSLLCVKASPCKSLLCVKASVCKSFCV